MFAGKFPVSGADGSSLLLRLYIILHVTSCPTLPILVQMYAFKFLFVGAWLYTSASWFNSYLGPLSHVGWPGELVHTCLTVSFRIFLLVRKYDVLNIFDFQPSGESCYSSISTILSWISILWRGVATLV